MSEHIAKICKNCGPLKSNRVRITVSKKGHRITECINCRTQQTKRCRAKNPLTKIRKYCAHKGKKRLQRAELRTIGGTMECKLCKNSLDLKKFYLSMIYRPFPVCKDCSNKHNNARYLIKKNKHYLKKYGISYTEFKNKSREQNDLCAICNEPQKIINKKHNLNDLYIDHCHKTGKMRGLICSTCNLGIGQFNDSYDLFIRVARYLKKYSAN